VTILVLTGTCTSADAEASTVQPAIVPPDLAALLPLTTEGT